MKHFFYTARMCTKEQGYFGLLYLLSGYFFRFIKLGAMLMLWQMLLQGGVDSDGMTLKQMWSYTLISFVLADMLNIQSPASDWIHEGNILTHYMRPMGIFTQLAAHTIGKWGMPMLMCSLPMLIIGGVAGIPILPQSAWFLLSLVLAVSLGFAVDFVFACMMIKAHNVTYMILLVRMAVYTLLSGALIPFAMLPWGIGDVLQKLPFGALAGAPLSLYVGISQPWDIIPIQILWNLVLWPLVMIWFKRSQEAMVSYGG